MASLLLRRGEGGRVVIENEKFDQKGSLSLFGIRRDKSEEEIHLYREIVKEREIFGRGEIKHSSM